MLISLLRLKAVEIRATYGSSPTADQQSLARQTDVDAMTSISTFPSTFKLTFTLQGLLSVGYF